MLLMQFGIYLLIGMFAGFASGLLGIGGGIIVVPALFWVFSYLQLAPDLTMHLAAGTSLAAMIVTTLVALWSHAHDFSEIKKIIQRMFLGATLGTFMGVLAANYLDSSILKLVFGILVLFTAINMLFNFGLHASEGKSPNIWLSQFSSLIIGLLSGLLGIGGSTLLIPYLHYFNYNMRRIIAKSTALGFLIAIVGTICMIIFGWDKKALPNYAIGYVYWPAAVSIMLTSPLFAVIGAWCSKHLPVYVLRQMFAIFLVLVSFNMIFAAKLF